MIKDKKIMLKALLPSDVTDSEIDTLLELSKLIILNRRYPTGYNDFQDVPTQYTNIQIQGCIAMYNKKGAEGQLSHSENGISRTYETGDFPESLLKQILPMVGSVRASIGIK